MFDTLSEKFTDTLTSLRGKDKISDENIESALKDVRTALLQADVNFKVVKAFVSQVKEKALGQKVARGVDPGEQFVKIIHDELTALMGGEHKELELNEDPSVILIVGLNGAGKTTFTGKLGLHLRQKRKKDVYLVPADNFRPAAKDQLLTHAKNLGLDYFDSDLSMRPAEIGKAALAKAKELGKSVVVIDTAGRLEVDETLMGELVDLKKTLPEKSETILVADAMTGQAAVDVADVFHQKVGLTGVVLSKMDSDARGGAALSIRHVTGVPIRFVSVGEKMKDLEPFHPDRLAGRILDMGDVVSLVEKAQEAIDEKEAEKMMNKIEKGRFTIDDFLKQMNMMSKLGSFQGILKMIPGMGQMGKQLGDLGAPERELKQFRIMIDSMTQKEREDHTLLKMDSRIGRIARGSGKSPGDVRQFVQKFEQMRTMMTSMAGMMKGGFPGMPGMPGVPGSPQVPDGTPGFRSQPGQAGKKRKKGKGKSPFGKKFF